MTDKKVVFKRIAALTTPSNNKHVYTGLNNPSILCNFSKTRFAIVRRDVIGPCDVYFSTPFLIDRIVVKMLAHFRQKIQRVLNALEEALIIPHPIVPRDCSFSISIRDLSSGIISD